MKAFVFREGPGPQISILNAGQELPFDNLCKCTTIFFLCGPPIVGSHPLFTIYDLYFLISAMLHAMVSVKRITSAPNSVLGKGHVFRSGILFVSLPVSSRISCFFKIPISVNL